MLRKEKPLVSVLIPVFGTEKYLESCLESVALQDFQGIEIIVVDDSGKTSSVQMKKGEESAKENPENLCLSAEQIVKSFRKKHGIKKNALRLIKHKENKGLLEARRTALYEASAGHIMFVDSDDTLPPGAVKVLYEKALLQEACIVHGKAAAVLKENGSEKRLQEMKKKAENVFQGGLSGRDIFDGFLVSGNHSGFLWGKIFRRSVLVSAFERIPPCWCVFGEDFLSYFFISFFAEKYAGIEEIVYNYSVDTGISSAKKIADINEWKKICSAASVFTVIFSGTEEKSEGSLQDSSSGDESRIPLSFEESERLRQICRSYALNNLMQLKKAVLPSLYQDARKELCLWWGENMISDIEKSMEEAER